MRRFMGEKLPEEGKTTIGMDFFHKTFTTKGGEVRRGEMRGSGQIYDAFMTYLPKNMYK